MIIIKTANGDRFINESEAQSVTHNKEYGFVVITFKDGHSENAFQVESMYYTNKQDVEILKTQANKAEQEVYARIGRNYFDIIKEWGEVPLSIKQAALILTCRELIERPYEDGNVVKMLLQPYKKQMKNN